MPAHTDFIALLTDPELLQLMLFACPDSVLATDATGAIAVFVGASEGDVRVLPTAPSSITRTGMKYREADPEDAPRGWCCRMDVARFSGNFTNVGSRKPVNVIAPAADIVINKVPGGMALPGLRVGTPRIAATIPTIPTKTSMRPDGSAAPADIR